MPHADYFNCSGYNKGKRKTCNSTHYIWVDFLEKVVLGEIRRLTKLVTQYESEFAKIVMGHSIKAAEQEIVNNQGKWAELLAQVRASDFYEKNGYIKSAEICDDEGCPHVWMRKKLI